MTLCVLATVGDVGVLGALVDADILGAIIKCRRCP